VSGEGSESAVELAPDGGDFPGILRKGFLTPAKGDGTEQGDEGGGGGEDDTLVDTFFDEGGVLAEGGGEEGFAGEEEDDKFWGRVELLLVVFAAELLDVGADLGGVAGEGSFAHCVVVGFDGIEVGVHRGFGVDNDVLSAGEFDNEIGAEAFAFIRGGGGLGFEVAVLLHACHFDDAAELDLTPLSTAVGLAEGFDEFLGFLFEADVAFGDVDDLLFEGGVVALAEFFAFGDLLLDFFEGLGNGFDHLLDGGLAFFQIAFGFLLLGFEAVFGEDEKLILGGFQGIGGEGLEGVRKFGFGLFEQGLFFFGGLTLFLHADFEFSLLLLQSGFFLLKCFVFRLKVFQIFLGCFVQ